MTTIERCARRLSVGAAVVALAMAGCADDGSDGGDDMGAVDGSTGATTGGGGTQTGDTEGPGDTGTTGAGESDTGVGETGVGETGSGETTGGTLHSCAAATTPEQCAAVDNELASCSWYEVTAVADAAACTGRPAGGACVDGAALDGCAHPSPEPPACDGSDVRWFYAEDEGGGWRLFSGTGESFCGNLPSGWAECYHTDFGAPEDIQAICACACSMP